MADTQAPSKELLDPNSVLPTLRGMHHVAIRSGRTVTMDAAALTQVIEYIELLQERSRRAAHEPCEGDQGLPAEVYEEAMEDFVRMQHDIARLLGVDAETDSDDLHERIYTELSRRAAQPPDPALDRVQDIIEGMHCECDVSVGLTCHPCRAIKVIAEARRASPTKRSDDHG